MTLLSPLVSNFSGLVQRHLNNFGPSPDSTPSTRALSPLLHVTRAELHTLEHDVARNSAPVAAIAAGWIRAAALLTGAAGDILNEVEYPLTANRHAARAKLVAAFEALEQSIGTAITEYYPLPDTLDEVIHRIQTRLQYPFGTE